MKKEKIIEHLPYILILIIISFLCIKKYADNDIFFDIKTGESILKYGIDFKDHFSFITGLRYIYHHWFYDLVIYFIFKNFKYKGLLMFYFLFASILSLVMYKIFNENIKNKFFSVIFAGLLIYMFGVHLSTRVQTITYPMFVLYIYFLDKFHKTGLKKYIIYLLLISIFINNNHMTMWLLTIIFMIPYLVEIICYHIKNNKKIGKIFKIIDKRIEFEKPKNEKIFLIGCLLIFLSGLLTPLKLWPYKFAFISLKNNNIFTHISEMNKTVLFDFRNALIVIILAFLILIFDNKKVKFRDVCYTFGIFLLALMAKRNIPYLGFLLPIILCKYLSFENIKLPNIKINKKVISITISFMLIMILGLILNEVRVKKFNYNIEKMYPIKITDYLLKETDYKNIILFNEYDYGSYLEFKDIPVLVDSRAEVYIKDFNKKQDVLVEFFDLKDDNSIKKNIEKYKYDYFVVYKDTAISKYLSSNKDKYQKIMSERKTFELYKTI